MIAASRPALQIFPPAERPQRKDSLRRPPAQQTAPPRRSLDRSKAQADFHELIIQVPANHSKAPPQIAYMPPPQPPAPIYIEPTRRRTPSPVANNAFLADGGSTSGIRTPGSEHPARTASLTHRNGRTQRPKTPPAERRYASAPMAPRTPEPSQAPNSAIFGSTNREARGWSPEPSSGAPKMAGWSPNSSRDPRMASPASALTGSPTLVRTMSGKTVGRSPISPQEKTKEKTKEKPLEYIPMESIFPTYNPGVPLEAQDYRPTRIVASPEIPREQISKAPYSPPVGASTPRSHFITPSAEMYRLWDASNGMLVDPTGPTNISLQLNRPGASIKSNASAKEKPQLTLGSSAKEPFYSLRQSNLEPEIVTDPSGQAHALEEYELLVFRHNPSRPDVLPIAHMNVSPPPPPSLSTTHSIPVASSSGFPLDVEAHASDAQHLPHHITTITPTIATLTALSASANSPAASVIARSDPNADSLQARQLAARAVQAAEEQESVEVLWRRTGPAGGGAYELLHPALGVMKMRVEGDVSGRLDASSKTSNRAAKISLLNPSLLKPDSEAEKYGAASSSSAEDDAVLASLDLADDVLDVNMPAIHSLRNPYLFDVSVCALLAVAAAEAKRPEDPGLKFDAPPVSKLQKKGTYRPKPQPQRKQKPRDEDGLEELPKATKGVLAIVRILGKSVIWILTLGVKMVLAILRGLFRCLLSKKGNK